MQTFSLIFVFKVYIPRTLHIWIQIVFSFFSILVFAQEESLDGQYNEILRHFFEQKITCFPMPRRTTFLTLSQQSLLSITYKTEEQCFENPFQLWLEAVTHLHLISKTTVTNQRFDQQILPEAEASLLWEFIGKFSCLC